MGAHGASRARVLTLVREEPHDNPIPDVAIAADLGISEPAVSHIRRAMTIPPSRARASIYAEGYAIGPAIGQCRCCVGRWYEIPTGQGAVPCPEGHGRVLASGYRLVLRNPSV